MNRMSWIIPPTSPSWPPAPAVRVVCRDVVITPRETLRCALMQRGGEESIVLALGVGRGATFVPDPAVGGVEIPEAAVGRLVLALLDLGDE